MGVEMNLLVAGAVAGVTGTVVMDLGNQLLARLGWISKIDAGTIGRMAGGWLRGRFRYGHPSEMKEVPGEWVLGTFTHYGIGVGLALPFLVGWDVLLGGLPSPAWALVYGVGTTAASYFLVYPSMGFGVCGLRSPEGLKATLSSLVNHGFYGLGLAAGVALM
jgi:uncharacterized membrane protein YeaQ/YmgE (transglycosylase-associated protein family)